MLIKLIVKIDTIWDLKFSHAFQELTHTRWTLEY